MLEIHGAPKGEIGKSRFKRNLRLPPYRGSENYNQNRETKSEHFDLTDE